MAQKRKKKSSSKIYWPSEQMDAWIIEYNNCTDSLLKDKLFRDKLYKPLDKMAENIINRFKFPYIDGDFEDVKAQTVSYLVMKLSNFTEDKGKSFSYFSVVAKNYLILQNNKAYKKLKRTVYFMDDQEDGYSLEETLLVDPEEHYHDSERLEFIKLFMRYWDKHIHRIFPNDRDLEIAYAILQLLRHSHMIQNYNKKAIYLMIREITDCKTSNITKIVKEIKKISNSQFREFQKTGKLPDYFSD